MKDNNYETVVKLLNGALKMLQYAQDEVVEFGAGLLEQGLATDIREQILLVNRLNNKVINRQRMLKFSGGSSA